jgi:hypothetical protein
LVPNPAKGKNYFIFYEKPVEEIMYVEKAWGMIPPLLKKILYGFSI